MNKTKRLPYKRAICYSGFRDDDALSVRNFLYSTIHVLHIERCVGQSTAFPERITVSEEDVAGFCHLRPVLELIIGIYITHRNIGGESLSDLGHEVEEFGLFQITAVKNFVAYCGDIHGSRLREFDQFIDFIPVFYPHSRQARRQQACLSPWLWLLAGCVHCPEW